MKPETDYPAPAKPASAATLDPWARLASGVILHALEELAGNDLRAAADAFLWFADPSSTAGYFVGIAMPEAEPRLLLKKAKLSKVRQMARKGRTT